MFVSLFSYADWLYPSFVIQNEISELLQVYSYLGQGGILAYINTQWKQVGDDLYNLRIN
jgi:hypothetical protein